MTTTSWPGSGGHQPEHITLAGRYGPVAGLRAAPATPRATGLLVPGYTGSKEDFLPLLAALATAGVEAIAIDLPGQYESPGPARQRAYYPAELGAVVAELVEKLAAGGGPVLLLGHSYGGLVARGAVLAGAEVGGLTLLDSGPAAFPTGARHVALVAGRPTLAERGVEAAWRLRVEVAAQSPGWSEKPAGVKEFERKVFLSSTQQGLLGMAAALLSEPDLVDALAAKLRERAIPCAVLCGEADDAWSPESQRAMAGRLAASFHTIAGARHSPNTENPQGLLDVMIPQWTHWSHRWH